jgi:hypothetical protein
VLERLGDRAAGLDEAITDAIDSSITALPAVLPVISIACMIGTPAETSDENVRDQRAIATFCTTSPIFSGNAELEGVPARPAPFRALEVDEADDQHRDHNDEDVPLVVDEVREVDHELAERRELAAELLKTPSNTGIRNATSASSTIIAKLITSDG